LVTLDFSACKCVDQVFGEMRTKMEWPSWYGQNLDALWDILCGMPYKGDGFTILRPRRFTGTPDGMDDRFTEYVDKICAVFQEAQSEAELTVQIKYTDNEPEYERIK